MHSSARRLAPVLVLLMVSTAGFPLAMPQPAPDSAPSLPAAPEQPKLWLKCGVFDPVVSTADFAPELSLAGDQGYFVVQFDGPITTDRSGWLDSVSEVLAYLPDYAYVVRGADAALLRAHGGVRYVGPFQPGYKLEPRLSFSNEVRDLAIQCFDRLDYPLVVEMLLELGAGIVRVDPLMIQARAPGALALAIAYIPEVQWVEEYHQPQLTNNAAAKICKVRSQNDGAYNWGTTSLWSFNATSGKYEGYAGQNFTAALVDTGIDGSHPAFNGKKVAYYAYGYSNWVDYAGHGTHTAGSALGNGAYRSGNPGTPGRYAGMAPLAGLVGQIMANAGYYQWCHDAYSSGAVVQSNSWGSGYWGDYDYSAASYDSLVRDSDTGAGNQSISVCFSAGNDGPYAATISPPATAKNVICVGATDDSNGNSVADFSSRGPCQDGRIKPDILSPGAYVRSCQATGASNDVYWYGNGDGSYIAYPGTSMSCPIVAGACVIVNEYYNKTYGTLPSPAMVKNLLINGAAPMPGQTYPGNTQGWGRLDLANSLLNNTNRRTWTEDQRFNLLTGVARTYMVNVTKAAELRISLVWTDFCGTANAAKALVNDLDLSVTLPNGTRYLGNVFNNGYSNVNGTADRVNNVEMVRFQSAPVGKWLIDVRANNVPRYTQDYTLVVGGPFDNVTIARIDLAATNLTIDPADPAEGDRVSLRADIGNVGDLSVPGVRYRFTVRGEDNSTVVLNASNFTLLEPGDIRSVAAEWVAGRGWTNLSAEADPLFAIPEDNETNNFARVDVLVRGYGVGLSCAAPSVAARPAETGNLSVTVHNLGNTFDTFALAVEGTLPAGWSVTVDNATVFVPYLSNQSVNVSVTPGPDALAGDRADFRLRATSNGNATYTKRIDLSATASQFFRFEMTGTAELWALPGTMATHSIYLNNAGNGLDTVELSMYGVPEGWGAYLSGGLFHLQARESLRATLTVMPPAKAAAGAMSNITIEAASGENQRRFVYLATRVLQTAGLDLQLADGPDAAEAGDTPVFILKVQNNGNGLDEVNLSASGEEGWAYEFFDPAPSIRAGDFSLEDLRVSVPRTAPAGEHAFRVRAVSSANGSVSSELKLTLFVNQYYDVELYAEFQNDTVEIGNSTQFTVTVNNTGNGDDSFSMRVEGPVSRTWRTPVSPSSVQISLAGSASLLFKVRPPADVAEGNYTFTLKATSMGGPDQSATLKFTVRMVAPPPPPPPPVIPPPPTPQPEPEPAPTKNRYVAWVEDHWQLSLMFLFAIIALSAGGAYAAVRRRRSREPPAATASAQSGAAVTMAPSAYAASPPPPPSVPPAPAQVPPAGTRTEEQMETVDMGPPAVPEPEPASAQPEAPIPLIPLTSRRSDRPAPTAKKAVDDDIDEILARLAEVTRK